MDWDNRARRSNEILRLMEALFTQEVPNFTGKTVSTQHFYFNPKTVQQPHPPYIIGGNTDAAIKRACRLGKDGTVLQNRSTRRSNWLSESAKSKKATSEPSRSN